MNYNLSTGSDVGSRSQSDLAINLFVVLLIVFVLLTFAQILSSIEGYPQSSIPEVPRDRNLGYVNTWNPVQPVRQRFFVYKGSVYRITTNVFASIFAGQPDPLEASNLLHNRSRPLENDSDPGAYVVDIYLLEERVPKEMVKYMFPANNLTNGSKLPSKLNAELDALTAVDIISESESVEDAWLLASHLESHKIPFSIKYIKSTNRFGFVRRSAVQGFQNSFK